MKQLSGKTTSDSVIRAAKNDEAAALTRISFEAKKYWNYPEEYFKIWEKELRVTPQYLNDNDVFVCRENGEIVGYYSLVCMREKMEVSGITLSEGYWLDHMFVIPACIGLGMGSRMFAHLYQWCKIQDIEKIHILADPHAKGFYEKMGCKYLMEYPSTIPGRTTPLLIMQIAGR